MTLRDWLAQNPPPDRAFTQSAAEVARRVAAGEPFLPAVRDLLDEWQLLGSDTQRVRALAEEPPPTGDPRADAYLGALAEHLSAAHDLVRPSWACATERFLDRFWFLSDVMGFRAVLLARSPAAFRRRGIFVDPASLRRC